MVPTSSTLQVSVVLKCAIAYSHLTCSGSTGKPKGVDVKHQNVTNLLTTAPGNLAIKPGRRVAQLLSISFDMGRQHLSPLSN